MAKQLLLSLIFVLSLFAFAPAEDNFSAPSGIIGVNNNPTQYKSLEAQVLEASADLYKAWLEVGKQKSKKKKQEALEQYLPIAKQFASEWGEKGIEVLVRMVEPHLKPVFHHLLDSGEWYVKIRALYWLTQQQDIDAADLYMKCLQHENSLVREMAALGLPLVIDPKVFKKQYSGGLELIHKAEKNEYVKSALATAVEMLKAAKKPDITYEPFASGEPGCMIRPHMSGYAAPKGYAPKTYNRSGKSVSLKPTAGWSYPLSGFHRKILAGLSSVPFGALKTPTVYHLGEDVAWFEEGAGFYAIADGVVKMIQHGGDWGGLIIVEHRISEDEYVCALYGHSGRFVFEPAGTEVKAGQLIGMMGLSFSLENGGHGSHCHFGIIKGKFNTSKCVGYRSTSAGKDDFYDPFSFLDARLKPAVNSEE